MFWQNLWNQICDLMVSVGFRLIFGIVVLVVGLMLVKPIVRRIERGKGFNKIEKSVRSFIRSGIYILAYAFAIIIGILAMGASTASIAAIVASCGVVIGLALQGGLSNLAGGIMILIFHPFRLGDYIAVTDKEGTVEEIGIFYTAVVTPENLVVVIPNSIVTGNSCTNYTIKGLRRFDLTFSFAYDTPPETVYTLIGQIVKQDGRVLQDPEPLIVFSSYADSKANFLLRAWCNTSDYIPLSLALADNVKRVSTERGLETPIQKLNVTVEK